MTHRSYADELEAAATDIGNRSIPELRILLRRAALQLRNTNGLTLDDVVEDALAKVLDETGLSRNEALRMIVMDWLVSYGRLPVADLDEDSETMGEA